MDLIRVEKTIKAPLSRTYDAWTKASLMQNWFFPGKMSCEVSCDFRVGGGYRVAMRDEVGEYIHHGEYREIVPDKKIVFTWNSHVVKDTLVSITFEGDEAQTHITLTHAMESTQEIVGQHRQGWNGCLENLTNYLSSVSARS